jgi:formate/nitrite transporter
MKALMVLAMLSVAEGQHMRSALAIRSTTANGIVARSGSAPAVRTRMMKSMADAFRAAIGRRSGVRPNAGPSGTPPAFDSQVPAAMVQAATEAGSLKTKLQMSHMLIRGIMSGATLGIATTLAMSVMLQPLGKELPLLGALVFPVGFVMLVLLGFELVTGNMALLPMAAYAGKANPKGILKNFCVVTVANFLGSVLYAVMFWAVSSSFGLSLNDGVGKKGAAMAMAKTTVYAASGVRGWFQCVIKAILCNWMVTMGTVLSFASKSTIGRIAAMWLPILTFFAHGYEHLVVNFFVIPLGMLFGADVTVPQWILWNMIPVFIGNLIGGSCLTGLPLAYTYPVPKQKQNGTIH